ncbi:MAG TPA: NAD(P)H-hydrate dehydratase [Bryobacteraceae bacterium]|nr:NAD(P)H-hydrate dehydratase [Bryobacteraceae bacterium]
MPQRRWPALLYSGTVKVLTAAQMRDVDRRTIEAGVPGIVLMENAGHRVVEFLVEKFSPLSKHRVLVVCGKGNNGGDGLVIARQLFIRVKPRALHVVLTGDPADLKGDAAQNHRMLEVAGCPVSREITPDMRNATLVIDAVLGTGLRGPAEGKALEVIRQMNSEFRDATVIAVDVPSGIESDTGQVNGEVVRADKTVTFTAPKVCQVLSPAAELCGGLRVGAIGSPPSMFEDDASIQLSLAQPTVFRDLFAPRPVESNKGLYGHVLTIAGGRGKTGAAAMTGFAALRAGAGLSTVGSAESALNAIASYSPEVMTAPLMETEGGLISAIPAELLEKKTVVAIGPGLGTHDQTIQVVRRAIREVSLPMVVDADALNSLDVNELPGPGPRVLTPHPGEMGRLTGRPIREIQANRVETARAFAQQRGVYLVLKGHRTLTAAPDGRVFVNPTNSPALATGGTGDVLTGIIAGLIAQFPDQLEAAVLAAVYLHGRCGQLGAAEIGEKSFVATDILRLLPLAMREVAEGFNPTLV